MIFELNGVEFGTPGHGIICTEFDPGSPEVRSGDVDMPGGDGLIPIVDRLGGTTWSWTLRTNGKHLDHARSLAERLSVAWRRPLRAGESAWLLHGTDNFLDRAVRIRPRRFAGIDGGVLDRHGVGTISCDAVLTDPRSFSAFEREVSLGLVVSSLSNLTFPTSPPFVWASAGAPRTGAFHVNGTTHSSPVIEVSGPIANARVVVGGHDIRVVMPLAHDQTLRIDALERRVSVRTGDEGPFVSAPGALRPTTRLANLRLEPGQHTVSFTGQDVTGSARCRVAWRDAYHQI